MGSGRSTVKASFSSACSMAGGGRMVIFRSPASQRVADAYRSDNRPFDHSYSSGDAEASPEAKALVGNVTNQGHVHPGRLMIMLIALSVVGRAWSGRPSPGGSASSLIHRHRVRGDLRAAHH